MPLPPGPSYLLRILPTSLGPAIVTYAAVHQLSTYVNFVPWWISPIVALLSFPARLFIPILWRDLKAARERRALGADPVPFVTGGGLGGRKIVKMLGEVWAVAYPSEIWGPFPEQYGDTFHLRMAFRDMIVTFEPSHIKALLAIQADNFEKGPYFTRQFAPLLGNGIFNSDGDIWKFHRSLTRPFFSRDRITDFDIFERHADKGIAATRSRIREGQPIDFQDMIGRFTLDTASSFLLGKEMESLSLPLPYPTSKSLESTEAVNTDLPMAESFIHSFAAAQKITTERQMLGDAWPWLEFWGDKVAPHMAVINNFIEPVIREAIERKKGGNDKDQEESLTLLDELVRQTDDQVLIRDEIINMLVAGKDTTSATLSFAVYMLSQHPRVLAKLRQEILDHVGPDKTPTFEDVKNMKFLRAVINETLRLYPAVPFDSRWAVKGTTFPPLTPGGKPLHIPADSSISYSVFYMHRRKDLWGPDALEFDPDRFIDSRVQKHLVHNPYIFVPFNAGPRICLGQQFAYNQMSFFLIRFLQSFGSISLDLEARPDTTRPPESWKAKEGRQGKEELMADVNLTMCIKDALWVRLEEATET